MLRCDPNGSTLDKCNSVKKHNERNIMKTRKNEQNGNSRKSPVRKAVIKVAAAVAAGIAGRCLLP
jgi:hypothetical protein